MNLKLERLVYLAMGGILIFIFVIMIGVLVSACPAKAADFEQVKDLNGIWEERVFPEYVTLPDLSSCEQFVSWSEDQQEIYMKDFFREKYEGASLGFKRCLDRFADDSSFYVVHECRLNKGDVAEVIKETDRIFRILCQERGLRRENPWKIGRP